jgi:DNA adenine methylase Dam
MAIKYKSPLGYPGGKTKMAPTLAKYFPDISVFSGIKRFHEPFLGGGSVSLYVNYMYPHLDIYANDLYTNLYTFWTQLQKNADVMSERILELKHSYSTIEEAKQTFNDQKKILKERTEDDLTIACAFYLVNRVSFSGLTEAGSFTELREKNNFSIRQIKILPVYKNIIKDWTFTNGGYEGLSTDSEDTFIYYDPPYEIPSSNLYGGTKGDLHRVFNHEDFFEEVNKLSAKVMISYNADDCIRERFKDWRQVEFDFTYVMRSNSDKYMKEQEDRKEIILMNY